MTSLVSGKQEHPSNPPQQLQLFNIAGNMQKAGLPDEFIASAIRTALDYEGVADLILMWDEEEDECERNEIVADIQELVEDCAQAGKSEYPSIRLNDLEAISKDIRSFKDNLLKIVIEKGGITHLSSLSGIPQPSLSRFFNSNAMPRRSTLLKISKALKLDAIVLATRWDR